MRQLPNLEYGMLTSIIEEYGRFKQMIKNEWTPAPLQHHDDTYKDAFPLHKAEVLYGNSVQLSNLDMGC
jgi:hypothetical protein